MTHDEFHIIKQLNFLGAIMTARTQTGALKGHFP